jgi:adenine/guanine phosphoribosyltransferase-like PRPP-binding protein/non-canonical (house-cleaning) NTP pyrophosphatase
MLGAGLMKAKPGVVQLRKPGKLPGEKVSIKYTYEYASGEFELVKGSIRPGDNFLVVDDVLASGGSARAARQLGEQEGGVFKGMLCLVELDDLGGTTFLKPHPVISLIQFHGKRSAEEANAQQQQPLTPTVLTPGNAVVSDQTKVLLFSLPTMNDKARRLISFAPHLFKQAPVSWKAFPDEWGNLMLPDADDLDADQKHLVYLGSFYKPSYVMEQLSMVTAVCGQDSLSCTLDFPFLPVTFERVTRAGATIDEHGLVKFKQQAVATAHTLMKQLAGAISGRPRLRYFDIHAEAVRFYNNDKEIKPTESSMLPIFLRLLNDEYRGKVVMAAFPDDGALKRFMPFCPSHILATCVKKRGEGEERHVTVKDIYNLKNGVVVDEIFLVDDLVQSGSTLRECAMALREKFPVATLNAFVVHAIFPEEKHLRFVRGGVWGDIFVKFYVCDTVPEVSNKLHGLPPFQVLDTTPLLMDKYLRQFGLKNDPGLQAFYCENLVLVASKSPEKLEGVTNAFRAHFPFAKVRVQSAELRGIRNPVNPQPCGEGEALKGALDRLQAVPIPSDPCNIWIVSAESASYLKPYSTTEYVDQAVVVIENVRTGRRVYNHSYPVSIPADCMAQSITTGYQETAGKFIALKYNTSATNWHLKVGGVSRPDLIKSAVEALLYEF